MRTTNQIQPILTREFLNHIFAKNIRHATIVMAPSLKIFFRVGPHEITTNPAVRHSQWSFQTLDLIEGLQVRRQTAMTTKYFSRDQRSDWHEPETIIKTF